MGQTTTPKKLTLRKGIDLHVYPITTPKTMPQKRDLSQDNMVRIQDGTTVTPIRFYAQSKNILKYDFGSKNRIIKTMRSSFEDKDGENIVGVPISKPETVKWNDNTRSIYTGGLPSRPSTQDSGVKKYISELTNRQFTVYQDLFNPTFPHSLTPEYVQNMETYKGKLYKSSLHLRYYICAGKRDLPGKYYYSGLLQIEGKKVRYYACSSAFDESPHYNHMLLGEFILKNYYTE